jgi:cephalosporin hydroxylase
MEKIKKIIDDKYLGGVYKKYWDTKSNEDIAKIINDFHQLYYYTNVQFDTTWGDYRIMKCPFDAWNIQEIINERKPDVIIETGTMEGGSALFMANILDLVHNGKVITIDIMNLINKPPHPRITYLVGSTLDLGIVDRVKELIEPGNSVMVILDSNHTGNHVTKELKIYSPLVTLGQYLVVEDSNINGHPVLYAKESKKVGGGPYEATQKFLKKNDAFIVDKQRNYKFTFSFHPEGYLKRIKEYNGK